MVLDGTKVQMAVAGGLADEFETSNPELPGGGRIVLLSPTGPKLKSMAKEWKKTVENAGIGHVTSKVTVVAGAASSP